MLSDAGCVYYWKGTLRVQRRPLRREASFCCCPGLQATADQAIRAPTCFRPGAFWTMVSSAQASNQSAPSLIPQSAVLLQTLRRDEAA